MAIDVSLVFPHHSLKMAKMVVAVFVRVYQDSLFGEKRCGRNLQVNYKGELLLLVISKGKQWMKWHGTSRYIVGC